MEHLPLSNWSFKKALDTVPDNFTKAQVKIIYAILLFSLIKVGVVLFFGFAHEQWLQTTRAIAGLMLYIILAKLLLSRPALLKPVTHIMLLAGIVLVWSNIFFIIDKINLATVQFVYMIVLSSFYALNNRWGVIYSVAGVMPVVVFLMFHNELGNAPVDTREELVSPGYEIVVMLNFLTIIIAHSLFYRAFSMNVQEKERLNQQLQKAITEARHLAASRTNFLSTMSHELRTPLNSVVGITELLLQDKPAEHQQEKLRILQSSTLDLLSLINNVLDVNKIDSDKLQLEAVPFGLKAFMENIFSSLRIKATSKRLEFDLKIDEQLVDVYVISDPTRLAQVIYNLVGNAIKFTEKGKITVDMLCVNKDNGNVDVLFAITDTGIGIDTSKHESIFELFSQAEVDITRKYGGTGLGLPIVKQVLGLFNSSIQVQSNIGKGSKFSFAISFKITEAPKVTTDQKVEKDLSYLKILVAEDNDVNKFILQQQLNNMNITPVVVENGLKAYEAWQKDDFDAVFLDLHMPVVDGYEATRQIRASEDADAFKVYLIAFTASVTEQQRIFDNGFDDFLYKPARMNDLREKLEKVAARKEAAGIK